MLEIRGKSPPLFNAPLFMRDRRPPRNSCPRRRPTIRRRAMIKASARKHKTVEELVGALPPAAACVNRCDGSRSRRVFSCRNADYILTRILAALEIKRPPRAPLAGRSRGMAASPDSATPSGSPPLPESFKFIQIYLCRLFGQQTRHRLDQPPDVLRLT